MPSSARVSRRTIVTAASALAVGTAVPWVISGSDAQERPLDTISVLRPTPPSPVPPGEDTYLEALVERWERRNEIRVLTESAAVQNIIAKLQLNFQAGRYVYDIVYSAGWTPELSADLYALDELIPASLRADIAPSSFNATSWAGTTYGLPYSADLLILYVNTAMLAAAGVPAPPTTWGELLSTARELTRDGVAGFALPTGQLDGIGGLCSHWIVLLQQAGGRLFDTLGRPAFAGDAGVAALQLMVDLAPAIDTTSRREPHLNDTVVAFAQGRTAMMMGWASAYPLLTDPAVSTVAADVAMAILPAGPVGSASIDAGDAWAIAAKTWVVAKAISLLQLYLDPRAQRQLCLTTGALPVRLSVLEEPAVIEAAPHAVVVREQMRHPYDNFLTPDYLVVTAVIGGQLLAAMRGSKTPARALRDAASALRDLGRRP